MLVIMRGFVRKNWNLGRAPLSFIIHRLQKISLKNLFKNCRRKMKTSVNAAKFNEQGVQGL